MIIDIDAYLQKFYVFCESQNLTRLPEPSEDIRNGDVILCEFVPDSYLLPPYYEFEFLQWQPAMRSIVHAVHNQWGGRYYMLDVYQKEDGRVIISASLVKKGVRPLKKKVRMKRWWEREESE